MLKQLKLYFDELPDGYEVVSCGNYFIITRVSQTHTHRVCGRRYNFFKLNDNYTPVWSNRLYCPFYNREEAVKLTRKLSKCSSWKEQLD
jgi:hypothetical protein